MLIKDGGGLWNPKEYLTYILVTAELQFCVQIGKEVSHKICVDKIVDNLLQQPVLRSKWNMLVEECGCKISKGRSNIFLDQILSLFIEIRSFSYAKDIVQEYKVQQKVAQKKGLRKDIQRAANQLCRVNAPIFCLNQRSFSPDELMGRLKAIIMYTMCVSKETVCTFFPI